MKIIIRIHHESKKPENAESAVRHMLSHCGSEITVDKIEPYLDKGSLAECHIEIEANTWEELSFKVLSNAQKFGIGWVVSGSVEEEIDLTTSSFHAGNGVTIASIHFSRNEYETP